MVYSIFQRSEKTFPKIFVSLEKILAVNNVAERIGEPFYDNYNHTVEPSNLTVNAFFPASVNNVSARRS